MLFSWSYLLIMALERFFRLRLLPIVAGLIATCWIGAGEASAQSRNGWSVCNETSRIVEMATGKPDDRSVYVEGWTRIRPGECRVVMEAPLLSGQHHYLYGRTSRAHRGGMKSWSGEFPFCVDSQGQFSLESVPNCTAMGLETRKFQPVLIESRTRWTTTLKETQKWSRQTAQSAGIQRLLGDAGIELGNIDGYIGRRTRRAIREFLISQQLPEDSTDDELIDYLEQVAIDRSRNIGLSLCNRTDDRIWTAIGRRRGEGWESRGWWRLEAGSCERVVDQELIASPHFVYAEMDSEAGQKVLTPAESELFCMSPTQFAILGKDKCEENLYLEAPFRQTEVPVDGRLVVEFFDRDFDFPTDDGL